MRIHAARFPLPRPPNLPLRLFLALLREIADILCTELPTRPGTRRRRLRRTHLRHAGRFTVIISVKGSTSILWLICSGAPDAVEGQAEQ